MIAGKTDNLETMSFRPGQDPDEYRTQFDKILKDDETNPTLVLVDLKGGTPFNTAMYLKQNHNLSVITGVNVPMLLSIITTRDNQSKIEDLIKIALDKTNWGIENTTLGGKHHAKLSLN